MPSSYTQSLRLVLPVEGENTGTWGDIVNAGLTELVEDAIAGTADIAMADADVTLTVANEAVDQARNMFLTLTGTLTAQRDLVVPSVSKLYFVGNSTTGGFGVQVKTLDGTGVVIQPGVRMPVYCDGINVSFALGSSIGSAVVSAASAADAQAALDVPSRDGDNASGTWGISISGSAATAATATKLATARTIGGVSFDGSANINLPGVNTTGNQNTTGSAATVTTLTTAQVRSALAGSGAGDVGTYALMYGGNVNAGDLVAGSSLRLQGMARAADNVMTTPNGSGPLSTGTWRALSSISSGFGTIGLYLRVS